MMRGKMEYRRQTIAVESRSIQRLSIEIDGKMYDRAIEYSKPLLRNGAAARRMRCRIESADRRSRPIVYSCITIFRMIGW